MAGIFLVCNVLLRLPLFLRSAMGFNGCFVDLRLIEGDFHNYVIEPLRRSPYRMEGMRYYLLGAKWPPVDALEHLHTR